MVNITKFTLRLLFGFGVIILYKKVTEQNEAVRRDSAQCAARYEVSERVCLLELNHCQ